MTQGTRMDMDARARWADDDGFWPPSTDAAGICHACPRCRSAQVWNADTFPRRYACGDCGWSYTAPRQQHGPSLRHVERVERTALNREYVKAGLLWVPQGAA